MKRKISALIFIASFLVCIAFPAKVNASDKLALDEQNITLEIDNTHKLKLGKIKATDITWWSGDKSIATVSKWGTVTAKSKGEVKITAKYNNKKYTCLVNTVEKQSLFDTTAEPGTKLNPLNINEGDNFTLIDFLGRELEINLKLIDAIDGEKANKIMAEEDVSNTIPGSGERWVLYRFRIEYIKGSEQLRASSIINSSSFYDQYTRYSIPYSEANFKKNLKEYDVKSVLLEEGETRDVYIAMILDSSNTYTTLNIFQGYDRAMKPIEKWFIVKK